MTKHFTKIAHVFEEKSYYAHNILSINNSRVILIPKYYNHKARLKRAESVTKDEIDKPLVKKKITLEEYLKEESRISHNLKFNYEIY